MINIYIQKSSAAMSLAAAERAGARLDQTIKTKGRATLVLATGASQMDMLGHLVAGSVDWSRVTVFHLDEYIGLSESHPASFRHYLKERVVTHLPDLAAFHGVRGDAPDPQQECQRLAGLLSTHGIDLACIGIGENGHLAFNDPPADFNTTDPYLIVELDRACRQQQVGEGWFKHLSEVPTRAISMSIHQILQASHIVCTVPDQRKADAVKGAVEGPVSPDVPASILQTHSHCDLYLDPASASRLEVNE
jgi:glucosamine-6-phosphate deaminase